MLMSYVLGVPVDHLQFPVNARRVFFVNSLLSQQQYSPQARTSEYEDLVQW